MPSGIALLLFCIYYCREWVCWDLVKVALFALDIGGIDSEFVAEAFCEVAWCGESNFVGYFRDGFLGGGEQLPCTHESSLAQLFDG